MKTLLDAALSLSTIIHELEASGTNLTEAQDTIWQEATGIIESKRVKEPVEQETQHKICEGCNYWKECKFGPCPYASDIHNDNTPVWLCGECTESRSEAI